MNAVPITTDPEGSHASPAAEGWRGFASDWASDRETFHRVPWGKAMMWIFLLSDTFIFGSFLTGYMTVRRSTTVDWPNPSEVFSLQVGGVSVPLLLIAIMTFVLISSSGTMAMAVNCAYRRDRRNAALLMFATAAFGVTFVGMQAFEWSKLIHEGVRPWGNPWGAAQFGSSFFMITGFHGLHVSAGVIYLIVVATRLLRGRYDHRPNYEIVEITGLYWHFVDLVWVFIFALFFISGEGAVMSGEVNVSGSATTGHQQHPIGIYLKVWLLLFVLSVLSYMVDYFHFQGGLRWGLILSLMMIKAGLIVAVFMHMAWERLALICAILLPPAALMVLVGMMASESGYTFLQRVLFFR